MRILLTVLLLTMSTMATADNRSTAIDPLFQDFNHPDAPGAAVMVIQNGKVLYEQAYGLEDLNRKSPCTVETNFRLASLTKQFTAMAILMLVEKQKLSLEDSITKFFPEFPDYGKQITVSQLLSHRSGLIDYEDVIPEGTRIPVSDRNVLNLLRMQNKTYFTPGSEFRYSNGGYALLSLIVEKISGSGFADFLKRNIFQPLGMNGTLAYEAGLSVIPNRAFGYAKEQSGFVFSDQSLTSSVLGDGGIYSSVRDLFQWDQALYSDRLISRSLLDQAFSVHSPTSDMQGSGYGYGWYVGKYQGEDLLWHYGSTCGFSTRIERVPQRKFTVIILTNRRDADEQIAQIARKIEDLILHGGRS
jgi:CubicO group peptidase (beta-lactamase class C family)